MYRVVFNINFDSDVVINTTSPFDSWEEADEYLTCMMNNLQIFIGGDIEYKHENLGWVIANEMENI